MMRAYFRVLAIVLIFLITAVVLIGIPRRFKYRFTRSMSRLLCRVAGLEISVIGSLASIHPQQTLLLANHVTYLDPILIGALYPTNFMTKLEVRSWPVIGWTARIMKQLFVHRDVLTARVKTLKNLKQHLRFENVCLFPEGTTTRAKLPARELWKAGHLWAAVPDVTNLVCIGIAYEHQDALAWVDDMEFAPHLWTVLKRKQTSICIALKTIPYSYTYAIDKRVSAKMLCSTISDLCWQAHKHLLTFSNQYDEEALCNKPLFTH